MDVETSIVSLDRRDTLVDALAGRRADPDQDLRPGVLAAPTVSALRMAMQRWTAAGRQPLYQQVDAAFGLLERGDPSEVPARLTM